MILADAEKTPNVVKCCNKTGLYDELENIQARSVLNVCYWSSAVALETLVVEL